MSGRLAGQMRAIWTVQKSCGGELELARLLHRTPRTIASYRNGRVRLSYLACRALARICCTLDGPDSRRTHEWWWTLANGGSDA